MRHDDGKDGDEQCEPDAAQPDIDNDRRNEDRRGDRSDAEVAPLGGGSGPFAHAVLTARPPKRRSRVMNWEMARSSVSGPKSGHISSTKTNSV